jgi:hypothetical protein
MKLTKYQLKALRLWLRYYHFGYGFDQWLKGNWKMLFLAAFMMACSVFIMFAGSAAIGCALFGFFFGTFTRDFTYFRVSRRVWPLTVDVIDWKRVQQLVDAHDQPAEIK